MGDTGPWLGKSYSVQISAGERLQRMSELENALLVPRDNASKRKVKMKDVDRVVQGNKVKCGNCFTTDIVQQEGRELRSMQTNTLAIVNAAMNCRTIYCITYKKPR